MNNELLQRIIEEVVSRLKKRAESTISLSVAQLREIDPRTLCCQYSSLHLLQADLPLLEQIADGCQANMSVVTIHEALACGVRENFVATPVVTRNPREKARASATGVQ